MKYSVTLAMAALAPVSMALTVRDPNAAWLLPRAHPEEVVAEEEGKKGNGNEDGNNDEQKHGGGGGDNSVVVGDGISIDLSGDGGSKHKGSAANVIIIWVNNGNGAETSTVNEKVTVTETVTAGGQVVETPAAAASHTVTVGGPGGLIYQPDQLNNVPVGDTVVFEFLSQNHTVSQSAFDTPCDLLEGGMDSGFMANPNNTVSPPPQVAMQVMVETPLWFYCRQAKHCGKGMTFSINPTADKTQAMFQALAIKQKGEGAEAPITDPNATPAAPEEPAASTAVEEVATSVVPPVEAPASTVSAPEGTQALTPGEGVVGADGSCTCVVTCSAGSFPAEAQGVGAFGGMAGGLPIKMAAL
ncbi:putative serine-threonine rich protein [Dactylonectria estremocensis]|uniref:Serine-threonine rich protein n=1 Tax=Dactylonectria estremocensis TaxID=1079267 RepID=A0A9P9EXX7_9HYPO|nr:putative serine-threonine rich protein [Dactylonectria estremocensis]